MHALVNQVRIEDWPAAQQRHVNTHSFLRMPHAMISYCNVGLMLICIGNMLQSD